MWFASHIFNYKRNQSDFSSLAKAFILELGLFYGLIKKTTQSHQKNYTESNI